MRSHKPHNAAYFQFALWLAAPILLFGLTPACGFPQAACVKSPAVAALIHQGVNSQLPAAAREAAYEKARGLCPQSPVVWNNLAILLLQQRDYQRALAWIHQGLETLPHDSALTLDLGVAQLAMGKPEAALSALMRVPPAAKSQFYLGMAYRALRDHAAARQAFASSLAMGYSDPYVFYALIEQDHALHDKTRGLQDFEVFSRRFPNSAWLHLLLGNAYAARPDPAAAAAEYRKASQLNPNVPMAHFELGRIAFDGGDYSTAVREFRQEIELDPSFGEAYLYAGTSLRRMGKNAPALPYLEQAVERDPNFALGYHGLAAAQIEAGQRTAAIRTLEQAEKRFPHEAAFPAQLARLFKQSDDAQHAEAQARLAETLSQQNNPVLHEPLKAAKPAEAPADGLSAIQQLRQCVERADAACVSNVFGHIPDTAFANRAGDLNVKAEALLLLHREKPALAAIQQALKIDAHQERLFVTEGRIYQRQGNQIAAIQAFLRAEQMQPGSAPPVYYTGMSFFILGDYYNDNRYYDRAARHFKTALELDPHYDRAEFMLGIVSMIEFRLNEARKHLEQALTMSPRNPYYHLHYGMLLSRMGSLAEAQHEMELAEKLDPSYARTHLHLGELEAQMKSYPEARKQLEAALRLDPHLSPAYYTLGRVYYRLGLGAKSQEALQTFQKMKSQEDQQEDPVEASIASAESRSAATHP